MKIMKLIEYLSKMDGNKDVIAEIAEVGRGWLGRVDGFVENEDAVYIQAELIKEVNYQDEDVDEELDGVE